MEYGRIISVTGLGGLFELVGSKTDGALVKSLEDGNTRFVSSRLHNFSHLESIEVYTEGENVNLVEVFRTMKASGEPLPAENDAASVTAYFKKVFPAMDFERVYNSDRKKMVRWISIIEKAGIELKSNAEINEELRKAQEAQQEEALQEKQASEDKKSPVPRKAKTTTATEAEEVDNEPAPAEEGPKKKTTRKKKTDTE